VRSARFRWALSTTFLLLLALGAAPDTPVRPALSGTAEGVLELPEQDVPGVMLGSLFDASGSRVVFDLQADLFEVGLACPACFGGNIVGTLDAGPRRRDDLLVRAFYVGNTIDGTGTFEGTIVRPAGPRGGEVVVGEIEGTLRALPGGPTGIFEGTWRVGGSSTR